jgi:hypothetical protein
MLRLMFRVLTTVLRLSFSLIKIGPIRTLEQAYQAYIRNLINLARCAQQYWWIDT